MILPRKICSHDSIQRDVLFHAKLATCLARIALWLHPPKKILACLSLSKVALLHQIKILYNLILLQRFTLAVNPRKSSALSEKMDGEIPSGEDSDSDSDPESDSESCSILTHEVSLTLDWWFLQRKLHLRIYRIIPLQRRLLHGNQIQMHL